MLILSPFSSLKKVNQEREAQAAKLTMKENHSKRTIKVASWDLKHLKNRIQKVIFKIKQQLIS